MVIEKEQSFQEWISNYEDRIHHHLCYHLQEQKNRVLDLVHHQVFQNFKLRLFSLAQRVDELDARSVDTIKNLRHRIIESGSRAIVLEEKITSLIKSMIQSWKALWERLSVELDNLSPLNVLKKGYTLCWKDRGQVLVRTIDDVKEKEEMCVTFSKGEFSCLVQGVDREKSIESRITNPEKTSR